MIFNNTFIFEFLNKRNLLLSLISDRYKTDLGLKKVESILFNVLHHFINTLILVKIVFFLVPNSSFINYPEANSCWYSFGTSALFWSISQIPGFLLYPLICTLLKQGTAHPVIAVFIIAMIIVGIIALIFNFGQKPVIKRSTINLKLRRSIIGVHLPIALKQKEKENVVSVTDDTFSEIFILSGSSSFCWIDVYGGNIYGPIFWDEESEKSENKKECYCVESEKTETLESD